MSVLEALPAQLTAEQIIAERAPYEDHDQDELDRALSEIVDLELLHQTSTGAIVPSDGLLRINELWDGLWTTV